MGEIFFCFCANECERMAQEMVEMEGAEMEGVQVGLCGLEMGVLLLHMVR